MIPRKLPVLLAAMALLFGVSCGEVKNIPTYILENADGSLTDDADYNFEDYLALIPFTPASDVGNQAFRDPQDFPETTITPLQISLDRAYRGNASLKVFMRTTPTEWEAALGFTADQMRSGVLIRQGNVNLYNKKITAYVWIPREAFASTPSAPWGLTLYLKAGSEYKWHQSVWQNIELAPAAALGKWNKIEVNVSDMTLDDEVTVITQAYAEDVKEWGIKVGKGDNSSNFTGYIYVDSISITDAD